MKKFCENDRCDNPAFKVVRVSVRKPGDQQRTLCASCEEAFTIGVQHGTITTRQEPVLCRIGKFLAGGFVVLGRNRTDPSQLGALEAWAYRGPLDFTRADAVVFGTGWTVREALAALDEQLAKVSAGPEQLKPVIRQEINDRELATLLAALRYHQAENLAGGDNIADQAIQEIATDGGRLNPLTFGEVDQLCARLNIGRAEQGGGSGPGLTVAPPPQDVDDHGPLFRVVYTIDLNADDAQKAAESACQLMTDADAMPPVLEVIDHRGTVTTIDLSKDEPQHRAGGGQ